MQLFGRSGLGWRFAYSERRGAERGREGGGAGRGAAAADDRIDPNERLHFINATRDQY